MKMTLLEMVQDILSAIEADEINSISDIPEGQQVAEIIRDTYFQMLGWATTPELHNAYFNLEGLGDVTRPTYLKLPDNVKELFWFQYDRQEDGDTQADYVKLRFCTTEEFFNRVHMRDLDESNVISYNTTDGVPLYIENDKGPEFYTIVEDNLIICDSFDSAVDATLQGAKTVAAGEEEATFTITDSFTPSLDSNLFPFLLAESKATAFANIKQTVNNKIERQAREQKVRHQSERHRFEQQNRFNTRNQGANFGRRRP